ncbi:MAG: ABC transporter substrate-binding protein [Pseudomonadota bacterium]|nr:ABC transporter substrate-binding protein [Pseudomonadota bacterium]
MSRTLLGLAAAALTLIGPASAVQAEERLYLYTENFPPYNMSASGRAFEHNAENIDGLCTELVTAALKQTELDYRIKLRNWDYGYNRALNKPNHGIFCTTYTEERAPLFKWVGPLTNNLWTVFAAPDSNFQMDELSDAKGKVFGGYRNDVKSEYLIKRGYEVSALDSDDLNPKRLELGQIDLWLADQLGGPYVASQQNVEGLKPVYSFNQTQLFLALNPDTSDALVNELQAGLDAIRESGMFEAIETKYGL